MSAEQSSAFVGRELGERKQRNRIGAYWWAGTLIWAGLVFGAESLGYLPEIGRADAWSWVFLGAGLYGTLGNFYRVASLNTPNPTAWDWAWGSIFLILGLGGFVAVDISWPLILVLVGVIILVNTLLRRQ